MQLAPYTIPYQQAEDPRRMLRLAASTGMPVALPPGVAIRISGELSRLEADAKRTAGINRTLAATNDALSGALTKRQRKMTELRNLVGRSERISRTSALMGFFLGVAVGSAFFIIIASLGGSG